MVAIWTGSGANFCWGLYTTTLAVGVPGYPQTPGTAGLAQLCGLLSGLVLAIASLLAIRGSSPTAETVQPVGDR